MSITIIADHAIARGAGWAWSTGGLRMPSRDAGEFARRGSTTPRELRILVLESELAELRSAIRRAEDLESAPWQRMRDLGAYQLTRLLPQYASVERRLDALRRDLAQERRQ